MLYTLKVCILLAVFLYVLNLSKPDDTEKKEGTASMPKTPARRDHLRRKTTLGALLHADRSPLDGKNKIRSLVTNVEGKEKTKSNI